MVADVVPKLKRSSRPESLPQKLAQLAARENRSVVSAAHAGRLLGRSTDTIYRWLDSGRLQGRKLGGRWLVYQDSVDAVWEDSAG